MQSILRFIDIKKISLLLLIIFDFVSFVISFLVAYTLRNAFFGGIQEIGVYLYALPISFLIVVVVFYFAGLYEQKIRLNGTSEVYAVLKAVFFAAVLLMAGAFMYKYDYSRAFIVIFTLSAGIFLNIGRFLIRILRKFWNSRGMGLNRVLIIGASKPGRQLAQQIKKYEQFGYKLIGFVDNRIARLKVGLKFLGTTKDLGKIIQNRQIDTVFVSDPMMPHDEVLTMMSECENLNVKFKIVTGLYEILAGNIDISELEGIPSIDVRSRRPNVLYLANKRLMDIVLSLIGLILGLPLWILIVIFIRFDSQGKAMFTQERVGKNGKHFNMYKFRTMPMHVAKYAKAPAKANDKRITRIGRFLRKTSLDELPQLINVLKGEMSLVGPRPEMPFIVETYSKWQRKRLDVKPGVTGLWQILGRKDLPLHENIEYDFYYIQNQSFLLDIVILIRTVGAVITGRGAF
ncbi:sugar transferase [Patescibacteria group bacterium]|nr:sugar transferase [Patescibacteria group bacterium]